MRDVGALWPPWLNATLLRQTLRQPDRIRNVSILTHVPDLFAPANLGER
jgi:hypothetical protein